jgi:hypothetical protein
MAKTEDDRMMAILNRDATLWGRIVNGAIDTGRVLTGRTSIWRQFHAWDVRESAARVATLARENALAQTGLSSTQVAERLVAEMTRNAPRGLSVTAVRGPPEISMSIDTKPDREVYGIEVTDPFTGRNYRIEATERDDDVLYRVEDMDTGEALIYGAQAISSNGVTGGIEAGRKWLEKNVFDATRTAEAAQQDPDRGEREWWKALTEEEEPPFFDSTEHRDTQHDYAEALADVAGDPTLAWRLEHENPIDILDDVRRQVRRGAGLGH